MTGFESYREAGVRQANFENRKRFKEPRDPDEAFERERMRKAEEEAQR